MVQGSDEWLAARCGMLTASELGRIMTPKLKVADNEKARAHVWEIAAQRISRYSEPSYIGDDMLRGMQDELTARDLYSEHVATVTECGFVTNDDYGVLLGASPDGLVGDDGLIEIKSRRQRFQVEIWATGEVPDDFTLQIQAQLLVTGRAWVDFISISCGAPLFIKRVYRNQVLHGAIIEAAQAFERRVQSAIDDCLGNQAAAVRLIQTERRPSEDIIL